MQTIAQKECLENVEVVWQDESHPIHFIALKKMTQAPLCAIAGMMLIRNGLQHSMPHERSCYEAIAVIPRGDDEPILFDKIAFFYPSTQNIKMFINKNQIFLSSN